MQIVTISSKNQITLPAELLRSFGLSSSKKLLVDKEKEYIVLRPLRKTIVRETAGSLTPFVASAKLGKSWEKILGETRKKVSKRLTQMP